MMKTDAVKLAVLITVSSEEEAALLVQALGGRGVTARAVGGPTCGFRAGPPGRVEVLVRQADLEYARAFVELLRNIRLKDRY